MALRNWPGNKAPVPPPHGLDGPSGRWAMWITSLLIQIINNQIVIIGQLSDLRRKKGRS